MDYTDLLSFRASPNELQLQFELVDAVVKELAVQIRARIPGDGKEKGKMPALSPFNLAPFEELKNQLKMEDMWSPAFFLKWANQLPPVDLGVCPDEKIKVQLSKWIGPDWEQGKLSWKTSRKEERGTLYQLWVVGINRWISSQPSFADFETGMSLLFEQVLTLNKHLPLEHDVAVILARLILLTLTLYAVNNVIQLHQTLESNRRPLALFKFLAATLYQWPTQWAVPFGKNRPKSLSVPLAYECKHDYEACDDRDKYKHTSWASWLFCESDGMAVVLWRSLIHDKRIDQKPDVYQCNLDIEDYQYMYPFSKLQAMYQAVVEQP